jgi:hypothetical protein
MNLRVVYALRIVAALGGLVAGVAMPGSAVLATEPFHDFVEGLRDRGYYDVALDYLSQMRTSPLITTNDKATLPYEEARVLIDAANAGGDLNQRSKYLDRASEQLQAFLKASPSNPLAGSAAMQLGSVDVGRGRLALQRADDPTNQSKKAELASQARDLFGQANTVFGEAAKKFKEKHDSFPTFIDRDPKSKTQREARDQARRDLIQAQILSGGVLFETAKSYPEGSADAKKFLQLAADKYGETYRDWRRLVAGLLARIKEGQCYQAMGDTRRALGLYADILGQPDDQPDFRKLKASALYLSLQCWTSETEKKFELATIKGDEWLAHARGGEDKQPDWLAIRYYTAVAHQQMADSLKEKDPQRNRELALAKDHALQVAKVSGPYQDAAKGIVKQLTGVAIGDKEPASFVDAVERGRSFLEEMDARQKELRLAPTLGQAVDKAALEKEIDTARDKAFHYFELAMKLRDKESPIDDINRVRYFLCYLDLQKGRYYDAAVLGEFVARHYPDSPGAKPAAATALAAYLQGFNDPDEVSIASRDVDRRKMSSLADFMEQQWPNEPEAEEAAGTMMALAAYERDLPDAEKWLKRIPEGSARRGRSEIKLGEAYRDALIRAQGQDGPDRPSDEAIDALAKRTQALLEQGLARARAAVDGGAPLTIDTVAAGLLLAEAYVNANEPAKAVKALEDPKIGPLTLATAHNPLVAQGDFPIDTMKLALRTFVAVQDLDKAEAMMNQLEEAMAKTGPSGQAELTQIYIQLGMSLETQVANLRKTNKTAEVHKVAQAFEKFLGRISTRDTGNNFNSLNWVAETFFSLGSGYDAGGAKPNKESSDYFDKAMATDKRILDSAAKDPKFVPSADALVMVRVRMARSLRRLDQYKQALDLLETVLKERAQLLDAQTEAAQTYMDWGSENPLYYNLAILGARKTSRDAGGMETNTFWGWAKIAVVLQQNPDKNYQRVYHEARINSARCRLLQAESKSGEQKAELLKKAQYDIYITTRIKPDLGGPEMRERYDQLLKTIQKVLGEKPVGLKAFEHGASTPLSASR